MSAENDGNVCFCAPDCFRNLAKNKPPICAANIINQRRDGVIVDNNVSAGLSTNQWESFKAKFIMCRESGNGYVGMGPCPPQISRLVEEELRKKPVSPPVVEEDSYKVRNTKPRERSDRFIPDQFI